MTTILTVITSGIENGTNITCLTYRGGYPLVSSAVLYFAGNDLKVTVIAIAVLLYISLAGKTPQ